MSSMGERITKLRKLLRLTQAEFAQELGITQQFVSQIEKGSREASEQLLIHLCDHYNTTMLWLTTGEGEMFLPPEEIIKQQIARIGEQNYLNALRKVLGEDTVPLLSGVSHPDLEHMISYLTNLWKVADEDMKVWARVQFKRAFPPDIIEESRPTRPQKMEYPGLPFYSLYKENELSLPMMISDVTSAYLPVLGEAAAGTPIYIDEALEGYIPVPEKYSRGRHFLLRAKGDSMIDAGIEEGDIVIVRPQPVVDEGDIAVFRIGKEGGAIKYYHRQNGTIILRSANQHFQDIVITPGQDIAVVGKVLSVIKKRDADQIMLPLTE